MTENCRNMALQDISSKIVDFAAKHSFNEIRLAVVATVTKALPAMKKSV